MLDLGSVADDETKFTRSMNVVDFLGDQLVGKCGSMWGRFLRPQELEKE